jgi:predicted CXXCH cytochrome family protein
VLVTRPTPTRRLTRLAAATAFALVATVLPFGVTMQAVPALVTAAEPSLAPSPAPSDLVSVITPDPAQTPDASPVATPDVTPDPIPAETAVPTATPAPAPGTDPSPSADPAPTADPATAPSADPGASPDPGASAGPADSPAPTPDATPEPSPIQYELSPGQQAGRGIGAAVPIYRLKLPAINVGAEATSPHTGYSLDGPDCALCHSAHTGQSTAIVRNATQAGICYSCHDGSGATSDVKAQFAAVPANNAAQDVYYSHPVGDSSASLHVLDSDNEFAGTLDRHAVCADCHSPHQATNARPAQSTTGWTAPGSISGAQAVAVANGTGGSAPTYTLKTGNTVTYEYQLCLKCHSGWTTLPTRSTTKPSQWALDKGVEINPANTSVHPVEAPGRNVTAQMAGSLAGTSPFKAWNFSVDSTIRCTSCHGDPATVNQTPSGTPKTPAAGAVEGSHASPNRGLLIAPYRDRVLKPAGEAYSSTDFALCYLCHAERPFVDPNSGTTAPDTSFTLHGAHMTQLGASVGGGTSIDTAGAGEGEALCAECHFRIHSTAIAYKIGDTEPTARTTGLPGLVNFAPNVQGVLSVTPTWSQPGANGRGSCTLTCHGFQHLSSNTTYVTAPAAGFTASPTTGAAGPTGLDVTFTDASHYISGATGTWSWTFGDGGVSTLQSPSHTYAAAGTYTVSLTVTRTSGGLSSTLARTGYITVTP